MGALSGQLSAPPHPLQNKRDCDTLGVSFEHGGAQVVHTAMLAAAAAGSVLAVAAMVLMALEAHRERLSEMRVRAQLRTVRYWYGRRAC